MAKLTISVAPCTISTGDAAPDILSKVVVTVREAGTMTPASGDWPQALKFEACERNEDLGCDEPMYEGSVRIRLEDKNFEKSVFDRLREEATRTAREMAGTLTAASPAAAVNAFDSLRSAATVAFDPGHMGMLQALESALTTLQTIVEPTAEPVAVAAP